MMNSLMQLRGYLVQGESVSLFREPDAGNLPVRFDERPHRLAPSAERVNK